MSQVQILPLRLSLFDNMTKISELPLMDLILQAEEKHGINTHMVVEAVSKDEEQEIEPDEDSVVWWEEFEYNKKIFYTFSEVKKYLLEEAVANGDGPEVKIEYPDVYEFDEVNELDREEE